MKTILLATLCVLMSHISHSQWSYERVVSAQDGSYAIAYTRGTSDGDYSVLLKMESIKENVMLYVQGDYPVGEVFVDAIFITPKGNYSVPFQGFVPNDGSIIVLDKQMDKGYYLPYFYQATEIVMKVVFEDKSYSEQYYTFNMQYSTKAFNFIYANRFM